MICRFAIPTAALLVLTTTTVRGDGVSAPNGENLRTAIERSLVRIETSVEEYPRHRDCFSCHHQGVPAFALHLARQRGFSVPDRSIDAILDIAETELEGAAESYRKGQGLGGGATRAGYTLWTLDALDREPDEATEAVAEFLLIRDKDRDHWRESSNRPPSEASTFTTTYVALRALKSFGTEAQKARIADKIARTRDWLIRTPTKETEDRVFRLLGLKIAEADPTVIAEAAKALVESQNEDGGWSQLDGQPSDPYATGSALVALHLAANLATNAPAYRRGLSYLLAQQRDDGTWYVKSRSKAFQPYFESGFPHGKDQFISITASAWATSALLLACPEPPRTKPE